MRKTVSKLILAGLAASLTFALAPAVQAQNPSEPYYSVKHPKVLVMTGGGAGGAEVVRQALTSTTTSINYQTTYITDPALIDRKALGGFDIFVQSGPARMTPAQEKALADFVNDGGGFLALHDALDGPRGGAYETLIGGRFVRHAGPYRIYVHMTEEGRRSP